MSSFRSTSVLLAGIAVLGLSSAEVSARDNSASWQGSGGHGATTHVTKGLNQDGSGLNKNRKTTTDSGNSATIEKGVSRTDDGYTVSGSRTGYNGNTQSYEKDVTKTDDGWSAEGSYETGNGKSGTFTQSGQKTENGYQVSTEAINQDGEDASRRAMYSHENGTYSKEVDQNSFREKERHWIRNGSYNQ